MRTELRNSTPEVRRKSAFPKPEPARPGNVGVFGWFQPSAFGLRISFGFRLSASGFNLAAAAILLALSAHALPAAGILTTKHNLSAQGPGAIRAVSESEVCIFCHTPHRASTDGPLWNHQMSGATYTPYSSATLHATVGQPTGASRLCLSCHDGTIALGGFNSRPAPTPMVGGVTTLPPGSANLGTDLRAHHPTSFLYDSSLAAANGKLHDPATLTREVRLDRDGMVQCTSCHDPHRDDFGYFLVEDNTASALCLACHDFEQWKASVSHQSSTKSVAGALPVQAGGRGGSRAAALARKNSVAGHGCDSCHSTHQAGSMQLLLRKSIPEQNCLNCHNGTVAAMNIQAEFQKISGHALSLNEDAHQPDEDVLNSKRHVVCQDCHDPHGSTPFKATAPMASGAIAGVRGISATGAVVPNVTREYELCFRCHADSLNRGPARVNRVAVQTNTRLEFQPSSRSYHPVVAPGKNSIVPSLIAPLSVAGMIYCTDCHNSDQAGGGSGTAARGPHGSIHTPLLAQPLELRDTQPESSAAYALCYKCHSRDVVLSDRSWSQHRKHVVDWQAACTTCHDPHGSVDKPHLINFNRDYVAPDSSGRLDYVAGQCYLTCHGKNHNPLGY
jgi:predicted CXXCH cytochrome family protein